MGLFWCEALLVQKYVPFFRRAVTQEKADESHNVPLDGLRGILALSVFFTHALTYHYWMLTGRWSLPPSQFYSQLAVAPVAMFFIITGYLFWTKAQRKGIGPLRIYFLQRLRRLYPAFLFSSALILLISLCMVGFQPRQSPGTMLHSLLPYLSFSLLGGPPLAGLDTAARINAGVTWTLRVEWMFYFMLPLLALFAKNKRAQLLLLAISLTLYFGLPPLRARFNNPLGLGTLMYFNHFLVSYFSIGMAIAYIRINHRWETFTRSHVAAGIVILVFLAMYSVPAHEGPLEGLVLAFPMLIVVFGNSFFGLLKSSPMVLLGQSSYSIYLLHGLVLFVANQAVFHSSAGSASLGSSMGPGTFWVMHAAVGFVVIALALFSYRYCEAPFTHGYGTKRR